MASPEDVAHPARRARICLPVSVSFTSEISSSSAPAQVPQSVPAPQASPILVDGVRPGPHHAVDGSLREPFADTDDHLFARARMILKMIFNLPARRQACSERASPPTGESDAVVLAQLDAALLLAAHAADLGTRHRLAVARIGHAFAPRALDLAAARLLFAERAARPHAHRGGAWRAAVPGEASEHAVVIPDASRWLVGKVRRPQRHRRRASDQPEPEPEPEPVSQTPHCRSRPVRWRRVKRTPPPKMAILRARVASFLA